MKLTTIRVLATRFQETVTFYRDTLGIPIRADAGVYVAFDAGGFELGVYGRNDMANIVPSMSSSVDRSSDSLLINLHVDDLAATIESLKAKGVAFETEPHDQENWGMRVVHLRDPEGNLLELYELLPGVTPS
jgi:catechol 2,3-dioxygenase-like lactoylglutathione lyase family enzyme